MPVFDCLRGKLPLLHVGQINTKRKRHWLFVTMPVGRTTTITIGSKEGPNIQKVTGENGSCVIRECQPNSASVQEYTTMHYKNGREAKNGDKVVLIPSYGAPVIGILYDATVGNDYCNGKIAPVKPGDPCPNLKEVLHLDDVLKALPEDVPDTSKAEA